MISKVWYKWPKGYYDSSIRPWYTVLWVCVNLPVMLLCFSLFYLSLVIMNGLAEAERVREDIF